MGLNDEAEKVRQAVDWITLGAISDITKSEIDLEQVAAGRDHLARKVPLAEAIRMVADNLQRLGPDEYPRGFYEHLAEEAMSA